MIRPVSENQMDQLLRARLRVKNGAHGRIKALRFAMGGIDVINRALTGQPFFALRETEQVLIDLDGRTGPDLVAALLAMKGGTTITGYGQEHIPHHGAVVIGATHPVGTFDFIAHAQALLHLRPDLKVVANREAERFLGAERIVAVDLDSKDNVLTARQTLSGMSAHLKGGGALLVFGSGRVADKSNGLLFEPPWRTGITRMSAETGAPIVPASANIQNSRNYYRTRRLGQIISGGNEYFGRTSASLRYSSELLAKLGGAYDVHYGPPLPAGSAPDVIQKAAEALVPGLYVSAGRAKGNRV